MPDVETSSIQINITAEDSASTTLANITKKLETFAVALTKVQDSWNSFTENQSAIKTLESVANSINAINGKKIDIKFTGDAVNGKTAENMKKTQEAIEEAAKPANEVADSTEQIADAAEKANSASQGFTKNWDDASKSVGDTKEQMSSLADFMEQIKNAQSKSVEKYIGGIATKIGQIATPIGIATLAISAFGKAASLAFSALKTAVSAAANYIKGLFTTVIKLGANFIKVIAKMTTALAKVSVYVGKTFGRIAVAPIQLMATAIGKVVAKLKEMFAGIVRIATYRLFRSMIKWITQGLNEGITALYQWSKALDQAFSKAMDLYATDRQYLNNSMAAMLEPLIEKIIPVLDQAVDRMVDLMNKFNQLFSALTGKSTWTKALKVATEYDEAAKDAKKSTDELKRSLLGFDEINRLEGDRNKDKSSSKTEKDYSSMFEELPIDSGIGDLAKRLRELIKSDQWFEAGQLLAEKLNELLDMWEPEQAGKIIAKKINNAVDIARGFITTANWKKLGVKFAGTINNLLYNINAKNLGKLIADTLNSAFKFGLGFLETVNGAAIGKNLSDIFNGFFEEIDTATIGKTISELLNKCLDIGIAYFSNLNKDAFYNSLLKLIDNIDFAGLGNKVADLLNKVVDVVDADKISEILGRLIQGVANFITNAVGNFDVAGLVTKVINIFTNLLTDGKTVASITEAANTMLVKSSEAISALISNFPINEIFNAITTFVGGIDFNTIGSNIGQALVDAINKFNPNDLANAITTIIDQAVNLLGSIGEKMSEQVTLLMPDENNGVIAKEVTYWEALGAKLGWALADGLGKVDWEQASDTLSKLFEGITTFISTTIKTADQNGQLSNAIVTLINGIGWDKIVQDIIAILQDTKSALAEPLKALGSSIASAIGDAIKQWFADNWTSILAAIASFFNPVTMIGYLLGKNTVKKATDSTDWYEWVQEGEQAPTMPNNDYYNDWAKTHNQSITTSTAVQETATTASSSSATPTEQTINVTATVDGDVLFNSVVKTNNQTVKQTGQSPLYQGR